MTYTFGYQGSMEHAARACATDQPISTKHAIMLAKFLRGKTVERARRDLQGILAKTTALPMTRFTEGAGHKPGKIASGKYPEKAAKAFLMLINSVVANADNLGLSSNLRIISLAAQRGASSPRYGRNRGRERKVTHIEVVVKEETMKVVSKPKKVEAKKPEAKPVAEKKPEAKPQTPKKKVAKKKPAAKKVPVETKAEPSKSEEKSEVTEESQ